MLLVGGLLAGVRQLDLTGSSNADSNGHVAGIRDTSPAPVVAGAGRAQGIATHPAGTIPPDLVVCAEPTLGGPATCVAPAPSGQYVLELAPGQYHITTYAKSAPTLRGYYTERSAGIAGNRPLIVNVAAGETLTGINPDDWS